MWGKESEDSVQNDAQLLRALGEEADPRNTGYDQVPSQGGSKDGPSPHGSGTAILPNRAEEEVQSGEIVRLG